MPSLNCPLWQKATDMTIAQLIAQRAAEAQRLANLELQAQADAKRNALLANQVPQPVQGITEQQARAKRARMLGK